MGSRSARGRQAGVAGLARLARPLVVEVVEAPAARARLVDAAEDLALGRAHVRGLVEGRQVADAERPTKSVSCVVAVGETPTRWRCLEQPDEH